MSIKTTKRLALGVIASLVFAPFAAIAPASAAAVTATIAATVGPVRVSFTDAVRDAVPAAAITIKLPDGLNGDELADATTSAVFTVTQAPTAAAEVSVNLGGATTMKDTLAGASTDAADGAVLAADKADNSDLTGTLSISTSAASGTYKGTIVITDSAGDTNVMTVNWSFTTTGKVATITTSVASVSLPSVIRTDANTFAVRKAVTVTLNDSSGAKTQPSSGDTITVSVADATNIGLKAANDAGTPTAEATAATEALSNADLADGSHPFIVGSETATADTETVTITPNGVMPAQGVAAVTFTATTGGYGVETNVKTALTTPSSSNVVKAGTAAGTEAAYTVDTSVKTLVFTVSGYTAGAAYKITVDQVTANNFTVKDDTSNTTATAEGTANVTLNGIVGASGTVLVTVVMAAVTAADTIGIGANNSDADITDASDAKVTYTAAAYAATVSTPAVTPTLAVTSTPIAMAGKVADTYANPVSGAVVTVTGTITSTVATDTNITATATTAADGTWSLTMPATTAATSAVSLVAAAVKTGLTISSASAYVVNFNATGSPATLTYADAVSDQDTATTVNPVTNYPAAVVPFSGSVAANSDEAYTIATAALAANPLDANESCVAFTPTTSPAGQVVVTGSAGVKFTTTSCATAQTLASLKDTVTVASGSAFYAVATKTGENSVTMTSGTKTASAKFYAFNYLDSTAPGAAIRNLSADKASLSLKPGEFAVITIAAKDAFGNAVKSAVAGGGATVTVKATGAALVEGPTTSKQFTTTDADGNITVGVVASQIPGAGTITITGTGAQLGAAAGAATGTTAGTNGLTASAATVTVAVTVVAPVVEIVYDKPTLSFVKDGGRIILSGTAVDGEGDIIIYTKRIGTTAWKERAKTLEVAAPGDFNGSIKALKRNVVIRVKQEGTGLFSNQIIVTK